MKSVSKKQSTRPRPVSNGMNILVFCSAQEVSEKYKKSAAEFASLIGEHGHTLVWGGTDRGLMKIVAQGVRDKGGKIIGITMELTKHKAHTSADEMVVAKTLGERKVLMLERADAIVAFPGGTGTLDEVTEVIALKRHGTHNKPVVLLNTDNFYEGLKLQLQRMKDDDFLISPEDGMLNTVEKLVYFADTPKDAIAYINAHGN